MAKIFISYRREDSGYQTDRLHAELSKYVESPERDIFIDVDSIPFGVDFVEYLGRKVSECETLVAVIGKQWLNATDSKTGERRLDNPHDFVRIEIASALKRGIPVVPLLLDGTDVPNTDQLPDELKPLARKNGTRIDRRTFSGDVQTLIRGLPISLRSSAINEVTPTGENPEMQINNNHLDRETETNIDWRAETRAEVLDPNARKLSDVMIVHSEGDEDEAFAIFQLLSAKKVSVSIFTIGIDPDDDNQAWLSAPEAKLVIVIWSSRALQENRSTMRAIAERAQRKLISTYTNSVTREQIPAAFQNDIFDLEEPHIIEDFVREELGSQTLTPDPPSNPPLSNPSVTLRLASRPAGLSSNLEQHWENAQRGDSESLFKLAWHYETGQNGLSKDEGEAARLYKLAADQGNANAMANLAVMYRDGRGGLPKNEKEAVRLYILAAEKGNMYAQSDLGFMYQVGSGGLDQDDREAVRLFKLAADQNNAGAQANLAAMYRDGRGGLQKDIKEAVRLYKLAAERGNMYAQSDLGFIFETGHGGTLVNVNEAARLYEQAAAQGNEWAQSRLQKLTSRMSANRSDQSK